MQENEQEKFYKNRLKNRKHFLTSSSSGNWPSVNKLSMLLFIIDSSTCGTLWLPWWWIDDNDDKDDDDEDDILNDGIDRDKWSFRWKNVGDRWGLDDFGDDNGEFLKSLGLFGRSMFKDRLGTCSLENPLLWWFRWSRLTEWRWILVYPSKWFFRLAIIFVCTSISTLLSE